LFLYNFFYNMKTTRKFLFLMKNSLNVNLFAPVIVKVNFYKKRKDIFNIWFKYSLYEQITVLFHLN
jgi:hypothetical protein